MPLLIWLQENSAASRLLGLSAPPRKQQWKCRQAEAAAASAEQINYYPGRFSFMRPLRNFINVTVKWARCLYSRLLLYKRKFNKRAVRIIIIRVLEFVWCFQHSLDVNRSHQTAGNGKFKFLTVLHMFGAQPIMTDQKVNLYIELLDPRDHFEEKRLLWASINISRTLKLKQLCGIH